MNLKKMNEYIVSITVINLKICKVKCNFLFLFHIFSYSNLEKTDFENKNVFYSKTVEQACKMRHNGLCTIGRFY